MELDTETVVSTLRKEYDAWIESLSEKELLINKGALYKVISRNGRLIEVV